MDPRKMQQRGQENLQTTQELKQLRQEVATLKKKLYGIEGVHETAIKVARDEMLETNKLKVAFEIEAKDARARLLSAQNAIRDILAAVDPFQVSSELDEALTNARIVLERGQVPPGLLKPAE